MKYCHQFVVGTLIVLSCCMWANEEIEPSHSNWPSFRGPDACGVADGQNLPDKWDGESMQNIKWKLQIPGLSHASPIIWQNKLFVTTAVSGQGDTYFKHGLYGSGDASEDRSVHQWKVFCIEKKSGEVIWEKIATEGIPIDKRHIKATYANSTPVTDGSVVVAFFGSQGVYGFDMDGNALWKKDLGRLDVGAYDAPAYEWGSASSPIIYKDFVILQCDTQGDDFIIALNKMTGETVWKTDRTEAPSWGTPTVYSSDGHVELITNSSNYIYGYNPDTGAGIWRLGGSSDITTPTPIFKDDIIIVTSGRRPTKPIFALRPGAIGDISLPEKTASSEHVIWSKTKAGPYMPTPLIYGNYVFMLLNQGILDCYDLKTGEQQFRQRIKHRGGGFSASPVAADGKLYLPGEDGDIFVVKAVPEYEEIARNAMGELLMASPALSEGMMYVRAKNHLFAISDKESPSN